jgi:membrane protein insertase Oxa1/YidC/SpoIIIJ
MKWFSNIMLVMIVVMGFSLPAAMGVYWFIGAIISVIQTLIMQTIMARSKK